MVFQCFLQSAGNKIFVENIEQQLAASLMCHTETPAGPGTEVDSGHILQENSWIIESGVMNNERVIPAGDLCLL